MFSIQDQWEKNSMFQNIIVLKTKSWTMWELRNLEEQNCLYHNTSYILYWYSTKHRTDASGYSCGVVYITSLLANTTMESELESHYFVFGEKNKCTTITQMRAGAMVLPSKHKPFVSIPPKQDACAEGRFSSRTWGAWVPETNRKLRVQLLLLHEDNLPLPPHLSPPPWREALGGPRSTRSVTHITLAEKSSPAASCTRHTGTEEHSATNCLLPTRSQSGKTPIQSGFSQSD